MTQLPSRAQGLRAGMILADDDPRWSLHSGGDMHDGPEWAPGDEAAAAGFWPLLSGNAQLILDLLVSHPGELIDADQIADHLARHAADQPRVPDRLTVRSSLSGVRKAYEASGRRRLPFDWWKGAGRNASLYATRPAVAALFRAAAKPPAGSVHASQRDDVDRSTAEVTAAGADYSPRAGSAAVPDAGDLLRSLIGEEILTVAGQVNMVLAVRGDIVVVRTARSPDGQPVAVGEIQQGLDKLGAQGSVRVTVEELGHRSAFVGAVLATLPGARFSRDPAMVTLDPPADLRASDAGFAVLDAVASVKVRKEQAALRGLLAGGRDRADCALCGHHYPIGFLVAAHVKKRSLCTDEERRDLAHVAMLACTFGCDALYEAGWITVSQTGQILTIPPGEAPKGTVRDHLRHLAARRCTAHALASARYFAWHRKTIFRGDPA